MTGWSIGEPNGADNDPETEVQSLYEKLGQVILPLFYKENDKFTKVMRSAIAINGSFFNTQRMVFQYLRNAYAPGAGPGTHLP